MLEEEYAHRWKKRDDDDDEVVQVKNIDMSVDRRKFTGKLNVVFDVYLNVIEQMEWWREQGNDDVRPEI